MTFAPPKLGIVIGYNRQGQPSVVFHYGDDCYMSQAEAIARASEGTELIMIFGRDTPEASAEIARFNARIWQAAGDRRKDDNDVG